MFFVIHPNGVLSIDLLAEMQRFPPQEDVIEREWHHLQTPLPRDTLRTPVSSPRADPNTATTTATIATSSNHRTDSTELSNTPPARCVTPLPPKVGTCTVACLTRKRSSCKPLKIPKPRKIKQPAPPLPLPLPLSLPPPPPSPAPSAPSPHMVLHRALPAPFPPPNQPLPRAVYSEHPPQLEMAFSRMWHLQLQTKQAKQRTRFMQRHQRLPRCFAGTGDDGGAAASGGVVGGFACVPSGA